MPTARILIWSLVAFLALGAVAFAAVAGFVGMGFWSLTVEKWRGWRAARRLRAAAVRLAFDPVRRAPLAQGEPVRPCPKVPVLRPSFFARWHREN